MINLNIFSRVLLWALFYLSTFLALVFVLFHLFWSIKPLIAVSVGFQKLGLDHIGLLDGTGGGSLSGVEGGRRLRKLSGTLAETFSAGVHPAGGGRSW